MSNRELDVVTKAKLTLTKYHTLRDLSSLVISNEYNENSINFSRVLVWKLMVLSPIDQQDIPLMNLIQLHLIPELEASRKQFTINLKNCEIPWDRLPTDSPYYRPPNGLLEMDIGTRQRVLIDPLSLPLSDPQEELSILQLIVLDVERLFPQEPELFIESLDNRKLIIEVLYLSYQKTRIYRQGMHEIAGLIFKAFHDEKLDNKDFYNEPLEMRLFQLYDHTNFQNDVYIVMDKILPKITTQYFNETALLQESIKFDLKLHQLDSMLYHVMLNKLKIQTPIWILRYFRLVLIREIGLSNSLIVWDKLFAFGHDDITKLIPYFILVMLLKLRTFVLENEHDEVLYKLLHYPVLNNFNTIPTIIQDCILLYNSDSDLKSLSKIMIFKYGRPNETKLRNFTKFVTSKKTGKPTSNNIDDSIGGNDITTTKDFERTRLELRLAKRVNDLLKNKNQK